MKQVRVLKNKVQVGAKGDIKTVTDERYELLIAADLVEDINKKPKKKSKIKQDQALFDKAIEESRVSDGTDEE